MLIVSRRIDESIIVSDDITITVLEINGTNVRIGVGAPSDVSVHREEVYVRIMKEQHEADPEPFQDAPRVLYRKRKALVSSGSRGNV